MNHRERFRALMNYEPIDRMPLYYFGTWAETKVRWREEGLPGIDVAGSQGPQVPGMDPDWEGMAADLNKSERLTPFCLGSLFGWPREWMGVEQLTYLSFDDPLLFEEIIDYLTEYYIRLFRPVLEKARFDFAYIFEDCCCKSGPLLSPATYDKHYARYYRRLIDFCHDMGVEFVLLDSDGKVDALLPHWLASGVDIVFPIEVGTWRSDPVVLRRQYGRELRMVGGIDKHVIPKGEAAIREHLEHLKPLAAEGGYLPMPDHRIPPSCSLEEFRTYLRLFQEIF